MQRKDHLKNASRPIEQQRHECLRLSWHFGFFFYAASQIVGTGFASHYLDTGVAASLGGLALIYNFIFARLLIKSKITINHIIGTGFIIMGATLNAVFGTKGGDETIDLSQILSSPGIIAYFSSLEAVIIMLYVVLRLYGNRERRKRRSEGANKNQNKIVGIGYCIISALISSQSLLFVKIV